MAEIIKIKNPVSGEEQHIITSPNAVVDENGIDDKERFDVLAAAIVDLQEKVDGLIRSLTLCGQLRVRDITCDDTYKVCGFPSVLESSGAPSATNVPLNWDMATMGQWTGVPCFIGQMYIDTTNHKIYVADGDTATSGFRVLN